MELNVSDIQHFSTGDGPGIRTTVFLKGCNLRCPWCHNPETVSPDPQTLSFGASGVIKTYGVMMSTDEIVRDVCGDAEFYRESGGGVTLSGGEPMLQYRGAAELAEKLAKRGVGTLIDTAGCVPTGHFKAVLPYVSDYYFDIKTASEEKYRRVIGGDLYTVRSNLGFLVRGGASVVARVPFIPGLNDSEEECENIARLIASCECGKASVLPFHRLGSAKYEALGLEYKYKNTAPPDDGSIASAVRIFKKYLDVNVE